MHKTGQIPGGIEPDFEETPELDYQIQPRLKKTPRASNKKPKKHALVEELGEIFFVFGEADMGIQRTIKSNPPPLVGFSALRRGGGYDSVRTPPSRPFWDFFEKIPLKNFRAPRENF